MNILRFECMVAFVAILLLAARTIAAPGSAEPSTTPEYSVGDWAVNGRGNHRALVQVEKAEDAVTVRIPWRRWDPDFESKGIAVYNESTGERIYNAVWYNANRESCDLVFQAATPGRYGIYYMPYEQPPRTSMRWMGSYLGNCVLADPGWMKRHGLFNPTPPAHYLSNYITMARESNNKLVIEQSADGVSLGSNFKIQGREEDFAGNNYTLIYNVRFDNARGTSCGSTVLFQKRLWNASKGYIGGLGNVGGRLNLSIRRGDGVQVGGRLLGPVLAKLDKPILFDSGTNVTGTVTMTANVLPDKTVVTLKYAGTYKGEPFEKEIRAEDTSEERYTSGKAPVFRLYHGNPVAGRKYVPAVWVNAIKVVQNKDQNVVFSTRTEDERDRSQTPSLSKLPKAHIVAMQARGEFNRLYPMGVIATADETAHVLDAAPETSVFLFPEDRSNPVMMTDYLPITWVQRGPQDRFEGTCQPGEYYAFQIGVWAARAAVENATVEFSDLKGPDGQVIPAEAFTCYNLTGVDKFGKPFTNEFTLSKGKVRPLWNGVMVPDSAHGNFNGTVTVKTSGDSAQQIGLSINVTGPVIANHGDNEPWRMSRIRWLNSTFGLDPDFVPPPYEPVKRERDTIKILNREITYGPQGLPVSIESNNKEILAAPVSFSVRQGGADIEWHGSEPEQVGAARSSIDLSGESVAEGLEMRVVSKNAFDGVLTYDVHLKSDRDRTLDNVSLVIPVRSDVARFMTGFGYRGGFRTNSLDWVWDSRYPNNQFWLGSVDCGLGVQILGKKNVWKRFEQSLEAGLFDAWYNEGRGGAAVRTEGTTTFVRAFSGATTLSANKEAVWRFRLYATPFKPLRSDHWNRRLEWGIEGNIKELHHASIPNPNINYPFLATDALRSYHHQLEGEGKDLLLYYGIGILSNYASELLMFKSLGGILADSTYVYDAEGGAYSESGGGHPWLQEHLGYGYSAAWEVTVGTCAPRPDNIDHGEVDSSVAVDGNSRLSNYYVEGLSWLQKEIGNMGLYLDGIGYGRETMLRIVRALSFQNPDYHLVYHGADVYSDLRVGSMAEHMEHLPVLTQLMFGERFHYGRSPDYWLTDMSGLPFGLDNQYYPNPGPERIFREMVFAGTTCGHGLYGGVIRRFWDHWGIMGSRMVGWWEPACPVKTDNEDVKATVYIKKGKTLVALASWAKEDVDVTLSIDWDALGLDPDKSVLIAEELVFPGIPEHPKYSEAKILQESNVFLPGAPIPVAHDSGWLLSVESKK